MIGRDEARRALSNYVETPVALLMSRMGLTPNIVTMIGLLIAGVAAYLIGIGLWWAGGLVALFAGIFDMFDGALARATGRASDFGALLDSTIDRVSEAVVLLGVLAYYLTSDNDWGAMLVYAALVGSIMVSYMIFDYRAGRYVLSPDASSPEQFRLNAVSLIELEILIDGVLVLTDLQPDRDFFYFLVVLNFDEKAHSLRELADDAG